MVPIDFSELNNDFDINAFVEDLFNEAKTVVATMPKLFSSAWKYFKLVDGRHNHYKFWGIYVEKEKYWVHFGRIGTNGQTREKSYSSAEAAKIEMARKIREQRDKDGYVPVRDITEIRR